MQTERAPMNPAAKRPPPDTPKPFAPFAVVIGHTRFIVLVGVLGVLLVSAMLFLLGAGLAVTSVWSAIRSVLHGEPSGTDLTVQFLEIVSTMLKAVVFYLIGVGFYSLFIAPLNLPVALGVKTLADLESKIISVIIVIMAITFLEHFIQWQQPAETLQFGIAFAVVVAVLVLFQFHAHLSREELTKNAPAIGERAQVELFSEGRERRNIEREDYEEALEPAANADGQGVHANRRTERNDERE